MSLLEKISEELKKALKERDQITVSTLRLLKASIKNTEIKEKRPLEEEEILSIIISSIKQRKEAITFFSKAKRNDLIEKEKRELEVLQRFLPPTLSQEELEREVRQAIRETGATSRKDIGKVMRLLMPRLRGRVEGSRVNQMVTTLLEEGQS